MIEQQLQETMENSLAGEPPLGFDPDQVVDRAQRVQRRRRSAMAATVTAVAVTAGVVTGYAVFGDGEKSDTPVASANEANTRELSKRLGDSLVDAMKQHLSDASAFEVHPAAETDNKVGGIVEFQRGTTVASIGYLVDQEQECDSVCDVTDPEVESFRGVQAWRDDLQLTVGNAHGSDVLATSVLGLRFSMEEPCNCPAWTPAKLTSDERKDLATDPDLDMPSLAAVQEADQRPPSVDPDMPLPGHKMPPLDDETKAKRGTGGTLTPDGFGDLKLGMPAEEVIALDRKGFLGEAVERARNQHMSCIGSSVNRHPVRVSFRDGLAMVHAPVTAKTPEGIMTGSTAADVKAAYPDVRTEKDADGMEHMVSGRYEFIMDAGEVYSMRVNLENTDCDKK